MSEDSKYELLKDGNPAIDNELYRIIWSAQYRIDKAMKEVVEKMSEKEGGANTYRMLESYGLFNVEHEIENLAGILRALQGHTLEELKEQREDIIPGLKFNENFKWFMPEGEEK